MTRRFAPLLALLLAFAAADANAISISMSPVNNVLGLNETVNIDVNVSGLGNLSPDSLGEWDINFAYDPAVAQLNSVTFSNELSISFLSVISATGPPGAVNVFELSLDSISDLDTMQPGSFTMATLEFELIAFGATAITPTVLTVGDALGNPLVVTSLTGATISGAPDVVIPEPSAAVLWMTGLLVMHRRLRKARV